VTNPLQSPIKKRALALHGALARFHAVFGATDAELVLVSNAGIAILGAGLVWFQFETPWRALLAGTGVAYVLLFAMLFRPDTAIAVGILGGIIAASWSGLLAASLIARWNLIAACGFGVVGAVLAFIVTLRTYRAFSDGLRNLRYVTRGDARNFGAPASRADKRAE
jgi:hypothetical protein